jgi:hypothetical protein
MAPRTGLFSSSVGTKILIGLTGFALFLYLLIHIGGNLLVFLGPEVFNQYAYVLEERNPLLPVIEILLLLVRTAARFLVRERFQFRQDIFHFFIAYRSRKVDQSRQTRAEIQTPLLTEPRISSSFFHASGRIETP